MVSKSYCLCVGLVKQIIYTVKAISSSVYETSVKLLHDISYAFLFSSVVTLGLPPASLAV